ncbi:MAG: carboxypeptidase-like regulatory domain-containing protein [Candidatus Kapabacteria bacterium]|nr:carboxypeptidase-like regulatory domain-containing protein [Ignavibacteriota bacterium]MCW5885632.1 carboxypeptidase-like regulatory domain-containing protein [Candidatus Kapabacteria bacterium]
MKHLFHITLVIGFMLIIISCDSSTSADNDANFGKISGKVIDKNGQGIYLAELSTNPPSEIKVTNSIGVFYFDYIPEGNYILYAKKIGYTTKSVSLSVWKNKTTDATIILDEISSNVNNSPPAKPTLISPINKSLLYGNFDFKWDCSDSDNDVLSYDFYLGPNPNNLELIIAGTNETSFIYQFQFNQQVYYWKVVASDGRGGVSESDVWSFEFLGNKIENKLLLNLKFDGNTNDSSPMNQLVSNSSNLSFIKDRFGNDNKAIYLTNKSFIEITNPKSMDFSNPFTISLWIRPDPGYGFPYDNEVDIISRYGGAIPYTSSFALLLSNGYLTAEIFKNNVGRNILNSNKLLSQNIWTHIAFVYDGNNLKLYYNGSFAIEKNTYQPDTSNLSLLIGKRSANNRYYSGAIDDIYVYNYALSENEINNLYK